MTLAEYEMEREEILWKYNTMNPFSENHILRKFIIFSANLSNFMPQFTSPSHLRLFKSLCINQHLSKLDQQYYQFLDHAYVEGWEESFVETLKRRPGIICTYHIGSYRIINQLLARAAVPFTLVVSNAVIEREGDAFMQNFQYFNRQKNGTPGFDMISAEMPNAMFKMKQAAKQGRNLLLYLDGNTGSGTRKPNENHLCIDFFQSCIWARKGIAMLSFLLDLPIYPVLNKRIELDELKFFVHEPIQPMGRKGMDIYLKQTTQQLYGYLQDKLKYDPSQWECWLYLNMYRVQGKEKGRMESFGLPLEDKERWSVFPIKEYRFLLDKRTYNTYTVPKSVYNELYEEMKAIYSD